ncbi:MAG: hypothetical protein R8G34_00410 [Paracoccaceae bacterium]|nr:hypothetical protein [Paracoccaceae bacterium]
MFRAEILNQWYNDIWEDDNLGVIDVYFVAAPTNHYIAPRFGIEPAEVREWVCVLQTLVIDIMVTILHRIEDEHGLSAMSGIKVTKASKGVPIKTCQQLILRFDANLKVESCPAFAFSNRQANGLKTPTPLAGRDTGDVNVFSH